MELKRQQKQLGGKSYLLPIQTEVFLFWSESANATFLKQGKHLLFNRQFERELRESLREIQRRRQVLKE